MPTRSTSAGRAAALPRSRARATTRIAAAHSAAVDSGMLVAMLRRSDAHDRSRIEVGASTSQTAHILCTATFRQPTCLLRMRAESESDPQSRASSPTDRGRFDGSMSVAPQFAAETEWKSSKIRFFPIFDSAGLGHRLPAADSRHEGGQMMEQNKRSMVALASRCLALALGLGLLTGCEIDSSGEPGDPCSSNSDCDDNCCFTEGWCSHTGTCMSSSSSSSAKGACAIYTPTKNLVQCASTSKSSCTASLGKFLGAGTSCSTMKCTNKTNPNTCSASGSTSSSSGSSSSSCGSSVWTCPYDGQATPTCQWACTQTGANRTKTCAVLASYNDDTFNATSCCKVCK